MAVMDPLLNTGFLWRCLAAYAGLKDDAPSPADDLETAKPVESKLEKPVTPSDLTRGDDYYFRLGSKQRRRSFLHEEFSSIAR